MRFHVNPGPEVFLTCQIMQTFFAYVPLTSIMFDALGNVYKQQSVQKVDHVVKVGASRRVPNIAIFGIPTCAVATATA
jgi:hypothetical protein